MTKSSKMVLMIEEMNFLVQDLQNALKSLQNPSVSTTEVTAAASGSGTGEPNTKPHIIPLMEIVPLITAASLLIEIAARVEGIVEAITQLASQAEFEPKKRSQSHNNGESQDNIKISKRSETQHG